MERHYFGLSTLLVSVALLIWSIGETFAFPQGPNVSMGSNPIVTIVCINNHPLYPRSYTVPSGFDLIITDIAYSYGRTSGLYVDGTIVHYGYASGTLQGVYPNLTTGIKVDSGSIVSCTGHNNAGFVSGYLAHE